MPDRTCKEEYIRRIHKVQDYMEQHLGESMTIDELANIAGFSKYHFSRIFQGILKEPLAHYLNRIRMENALFLLAHRLDKNMTDIAYELGFTDSSVFSRSFKNYYGVSPREYRNEYNKNRKDSCLLSEYRTNPKKREEEKHQPVTGPITITHLEEKRAVYVRHTGTYETLAREYTNLIHTLFACAQKQNLLAGEENWVLAIYHDNPEFGEQSQFRTSLCLTIPDRFSAKEDGVLGLMTLEGGLYAVGKFQIHPEQFGDVWDYMYQEWLTGSGYVPRNSSPFEVYQNQPNEEDAMIKVDIYLPVEPIVY